MATLRSNRVDGWCPVYRRGIRGGVVYGAARELRLAPVLPPGGG